MPLTWIGALALVLDVLAFASIWRSRAHSPRARVVWTAVVALVPLAGALAWLVLGRERPPRR